VSGLTEREQAALERVLATTAWVPHHVRQVQRIAGWLFALLHQFHGLGPEDEKVLLGAALLHDVGYPTDPPSHHKASARAIRAQLADPFTDQEVDRIALVARYHRGALPKIAHRRYAALSSAERRTVVWLAGMLRVADGLDRAHREAVQGLSARLIDGQLELLIEGEDLDEDCAGGTRKRELLERALGMPVLLHAASRVDGVNPTVTSTR
jgi:exopolyphosphatase/guanosine-5'-triphosphate,3'-diphosphate pyrophosphatase